jgi:polysaccharide biosynthesis transport protein
MDLNLNKYIAPLLRSWWLIVLSTAIAVASAYFVVNRIPAVYQAQTTLLIGRTLSDPNPSGDQFGISYQLAREYANIALREPVAEATLNALSLSELPEFEARPRNIFLEIAVIDTDPILASVVANELAYQLIRLSPVSQTAAPERQQFIEDQLKELQNTIQETRDLINVRQEEITTSTDAVTIAVAENDIRVLTDKLLVVSGMYSDLFASSQTSAQNTLSVFQPASIPTVPIGPKRLLIFAMAFACGFVLGVGAAYLLEYLDDTIRSEEQIEEIIGVPILGRISVLSSNVLKNNVATHPLSREADAFRTLRTNLEFSSVDKKIKRILVISAGASEGKTTIVANLAASMSQAENNVILVDGDLRSPTIHKMMMINETPGLGDLFINKTTLSDALVESKIDPRLKILPAGSHPPNSAELMSSQKMDSILEELNDCADYILFDGPPAFVADSVVLSTKVDGILLVVNYGQTRRNALKSVKTQLQQINAPIIGVVLNRLPQSFSYGRYYRRYNTGKKSLRKESVFVRIRKAIPKKLSFPRISFRLKNLPKPRNWIEWLAAKLAPKPQEDQDYLSGLAEKKRSGRGNDGRKELEDIGNLDNLPDDLAEIAVSVETSPSVQMKENEPESEMSSVEDVDTLVKNNGDEQGHVDTAVTYQDSSEGEELDDVLDGNSEVISGLQEEEAEKKKPKKRS